MSDDQIKPLPCHTELPDEDCQVCDDEAAAVECKRCGKRMCHDCARDHDCSAEE